MENKTGKKKQTQGRRKIEIKKIDNVSHRHVAFSKRRLGLFNKASELCILCGTQVVAIVESYGGKRVFTFGHPSADAVIERYLSNATRPANQEWSSLDAQEETTVQHYHRAWQELAAEKKEKERIQEEIEGGGGDGGVGQWWDLPIEDMGVRELQEYAAALEELKKKAALRVDELESATLIMDNNTNNINNYDNNLSCSLLPSSSEMLTMLMNNNNPYNDIDDCFGSMLPDYDDESHYYLEYFQN